MYIGSKEYWLSVVHPISVGFAIESFIRRITFGIYKPWLVSVVCGLLEEWKESKNARDYEGACG